jgi:hypothetical protein
MTVDDSIQRIYIDLLQNNHKSTYEVRQKLYYRLSGKFGIQLSL